MTTTSTSSTASAASSILTSLGAGTGIDTATLISQLVAANRANADAALQARQTSVEAKISALSQISSGLTSFNTALNTLVTGGSLGRQTSSSDASVISATLSGTADPADGVHDIEVQQLAGTQSVVTAAIADKNAAIGQGTLTINFGTLTGSGSAPSGFAANGKSVTITIDQNNDSLVGLAQAINSSGAGLTASIVQDTSGACLVVKGATGADQGFTVTGSTGLEAFNFGPGVTTGMTWNTQAKNAIVSYDGVAVERASNTISDLIDGVTLKLQKVNSGSPVTVTTSFDTETLSGSVNNYVAAYNELMSVLNTASKAGTSTSTGSTTNSTAGPLAGDSTIRSLKASLAGLSTKQLLTSGTGPSSLAELGIQTNRDGTLTVDSTMLSNAISTYPERVHDMFVPGQSSSSPLISVASAVGAAKTGTYAVTNVVPATSGSLTGASVPGAFASPVVIDGSNSSFTVSLDGRSSLTIDLPQGSYATGADLAAAFQSAINSDSVLQSFGLTAKANWNGSAFMFTSNSLGSSSSISLNGLDATLAATLGLDAPTATAGTNASGLIDGVAASATGNRLTAAFNSAASGLVLNVYGAVPSATINVRTTISSLLDDLQSALTADAGGFTTTTARLNKEADDITAQQQRIDDQSTSYQDRLTKQFAAMQSAVNAFKSTQTFLQQQIDMWTKTKN